MGTVDVVIIMEYDFLLLWKMTSLKFLWFIQIWIYLGHNKCHCKSLEYVSSEVFRTDKFGEDARYFNEYSFLFLRGEKSTTKKQTSFQDYDIDAGDCLVHGFTTKENKELCYI